MFLEKCIRFVSRLLPTVLPRLCILCGYFTHRDINICWACQHDLPILSHTCYKCARFLHAPTDAGLICGVCQQAALPYERIFALFPYEAPIIQVIIKLKFQHQLSHASLFADLLTEKICGNWYKNHTLPDLLLPVPLHPERLRERGFNQALEIAKPIAKRLGIPIDLTGVTRSKPTSAQSGLPAKSRQQNMAHAFTCHRDYTGLNVAILDDVVTTGHTIGELSRILKAHGAKSIDIWCCARTAR